MKQYDPSKIEKKWQKIWGEKKIFSALDFDQKPKKYLLFEFPYPSGDRLHVGHARSYTALDAMARKARMEGYNVLLPMGWDAFGLPAENYAIKNKVSPQKITAENIANSKEQAKSWGLSIDWEREINTTDPEYYKWTQWIFVQLFKKGLAYRAKTQVNWCPSCKTNLANEEVLSDGAHERCGFQTEKREQEQWLIKITEYADRLIDDLAEVDYLDKIKTQQINWIGRSKGTTIKFELKASSMSDIKGSPDVGHLNPVEVFTTRADTLFGCTYLVIAPEFKYLENLKTQITNLKEVEEYIEKTKKKSVIDRTNGEKEKAGVKLEGVTAINPINGVEIPIFVADYVLADYGTGAVMAVPAHDERDWDFAKKYELPIKESVSSDESEFPNKSFVDDGHLVDSGDFTGLTSAEARKKITGKLKKDGLGDFKTTYHLRDWIFSRQRYWGEPIPLVFCEKCGWQAFDEKDLPVRLPELEHYEPSGTGESPLAKVTDWVNTTCPHCGGEAKRETDTMPNWAGSNWYFIAYILKSKILNLKSEDFFSKKILAYWMPVDLYNGGMEHTTLHLLYSRFIYKFLYDIGVAPTKEPYAKRRSHGMILGPDRQKMSKSRGNVVNPDEIITKYGADTFRLYEAFIGPFDQTVSWSDESLAGCYRFLNRVWTLTQEKVSNSPTPPDLKKKLHRTIKKVSEDIDAMKFNTAVASMMEFVNDWQKEGSLNTNDVQDFLKILSPFAPHISEELAEAFGTKEILTTSSWPQYDETLIKDDIVTIVIQENGKLRGTIEVPSGSTETEVLSICKNSPKFASISESPKKTIYVPDRLINFVR